LLPDSLLIFVKHTSYLQRLASIFILGASLFFVGCGEQEQKSVQLKEPIIPEFAPEIHTSKNNTNVFVSGVFGLNYKAETDFSEFLSVFVIEDDSSWSEKSFPILGSYSYLANEGVLKFTPKYPFLESTEYYVRFDYNSIVQPPVYVEQPNMEFIVDYTFIISKNKTPVTFVKEVYPTTNQIPRNLLKFYVRFSGSMTEGQMLEHLKILDGKGEVVEHAFLEIPQELWGVNRQRLTILFDPGRIKRGMDLLSEVGAPFKIGKEYTLQIDKAWKDGQQRSLTQGFEKTFTIVEDDRTKPDRSNWTISVPLAESKEPLELHFNEPMDYALLNRVIIVLDDQKNHLSGKINLTQEESVWKFIPDNFWKAGSYTLQIKTILEDIAGNNLNAVFDVDLTDEQESVNRKKVFEFINLAFEVN